MSMSRGQPVVATPMAVEGMFAQSGRDVLVAETAEDFAAEVIRLYRTRTSGTGYRLRDWKTCASIFPSKPPAWVCRNCSTP